MTKRALILAGGGMKVAFQAGVLQVWLDEAGLTFDHMDGASGGVFNLALLCDGRSGTEAAAAWRRFRPTAAVAANWRHPLQSMFTLERFRVNVLRDDWRLDWERIRATPIDATFNVFNVATQRLEVVPAAAMTEDRLLAAVALPMWFPPVVEDGTPRIDAVFVTDANVEDAILGHGADEVWIIWTVSREGRWHGGFLNQYFQIIEAAANGALHRVLDRIEANNAAIARGEAGEFGRVVTVRLLEAEVALNYLVGFNADRFSEAVEHGVRAARGWCAQNDIPLGPPAAGVIATSPADRVSLRFREPFGGRLAFGADDELAGADPTNPDGFPISVLARMTVDDIGYYVESPDHELRCSADIHCDALGGVRRVTAGWVRLNTDVTGPDDRRMTYVLHFADGAGHPLTMLAVKRVHNDPGFDLWSDTTTFFTRVLRGQLGFDDVADGALAAETVAAGIMRITLIGFTRSLLTYRPSGPTAGKALAGWLRFNRTFLGKLWDVYASKLSTYSPF